MTRQALTCRAADGSLRLYGRDLICRWFDVTGENWDLRTNREPT
jgi:hypothetical protein